jgi:uncharacterized protein (DUF58 family)
VVFHAPSFAFPSVPSAVDSAPPAVRRLQAAVRGLTLTARRLATGVGAGQHPGRRAERSRETWQHRAYQPGDEPDRIDWKLFARSDRYFVREGAGEVPVPVSVVLDASGSMAHAWAGPEGARKCDAARVLAAAVGWLAAAQNDPFSLHVVANGIVIPYGTAGRRHPWASLVRTLAALEPAGRWPTDPAAVTASLRQAQPRGMPNSAGLTRLTVVITDGHEHDGEIRAALALRSRGHELILWHLLAREEREFPYRGPVRLEEWETGRTREADADTVRAALAAAEGQAKSAWRKAWRADALDYRIIDDGTPLDVVLRAYLRRRQRF